MKLYPDTENEMSMTDYKQLPALRGMSVNELRELYENLENTQVNAYVFHSELLAIALEMDMRKVDLYIRMYERRDGKNA